MFFVMAKHRSIINAVATVEMANTHMLMIIKRNRKGRGCSLCILQRLHIDSVVKPWTKKFRDEDFSVDCQRKRRKTQTLVVGT